MSLSRTITDLVILALIVVPSYIVYHYYIMPDTTTEIHCEEGKFNITFPDQVKENESLVTDPNSPYASGVYSCEKYGIEFGIYWSTYPSEEEAANSLSIVQMAVFGGTLDGTHNQILDYHGHQVFQDVSGGLIGKSYSRELAIGNRKYILTASTKNETPLAKEIIHDFFDSFEVTDIEQHPPKQIMKVKVH